MREACDKLTVQILNEKTENIAVNQVKNNMFTKKSYRDKANAGNAQELKTIANVKWCWKIEIKQKREPWRSLHNLPEQQQEPGDKVSEVIMAVYCSIRVQIYIAKNLD